MRGSAPDVHDVTLFPLHSCARQEPPAAPYRDGAVQYWSVSAARRTSPRLKRRPILAIPNEIPKDGPNIINRHSVLACVASHVIGDRLKVAIKVCVGTGFHVTRLDYKVRTRVRP